MRRPSEDGYLHKGLRKALVEGVRSKGITDEAVLDAMLQVPRHFFLDSAFDRVAYEDRAFPIDAGQTISQPYTVAYQTQLLQAKPFMRVLEIGTGSAYQASVLCAMKVQVFSVERQRALFEANRGFLYLQRFKNLRLFFGDGYLGLPAFAPFDRILVTAAAPEVPARLIDQLKPGGCLVIPVNEEGEEFQRMLRVTKDESGRILEERFDRFSFVPMLEGRGG
jgi:protein-L-isoaspartate(D-aspartate) O-methyltransferase